MPWNWRRIVDHIVLFSGDGDFRPLVDALQRKGVRVSVVSTIRSQPPIDRRRPAPPGRQFHRTRRPSRGHRPAAPANRAPNGPRRWPKRTEHRGAPRARPVSVCPPGIDPAVLRDPPGAGQEGSRYRAGPAMIPFIARDAFGTRGLGMFRCSVAASARAGPGRFPCAFAHRWGSGGDWRRDFIGSDACSCGAAPVIHPVGPLGPGVLNPGQAAPARRLFGRAARSRRARYFRSGLDAAPGVASTL